MCRLNLEGPRLAVSMGHVSLTVEIATVPGQPIKTEEWDILELNGLV